MQYKSIITRAMAVLLCICTSTAVAQSVPPDIKEVKVYGNSAQFNIRTMSQLTASDALLSNRTRIKIRFRVYNTVTTQSFSSWKLSVNSNESALLLDGGSESIALSKLELIPTSSATPVNSSITVHNVTISSSPQIIAQGTWTAGLNPSTDITTIVEAEIIITYKINGPFTALTNGVYLTNLYFLLEEV